MLMIAVQFNLLVVKDVLCKQALLDHHYDALGYCISLLTTHSTSKLPSDTKSKILLILDQDGGEVCYQL